jgi:hypothetical protein
MTVETMSAPAVSGLPATSRARVDEAVEALVERKQNWAELDVDGRLAYLRRLSEGTLHTARGQVEAATAAQGVPFDSPPAAEQWLGGPYVTLRILRLLTQSLESIRDHGTVPIARSDVRVRDNGQIAVRVFPGDLIDRLLYAGFRAEVWMRPEVSAENLQEHVAGAYRNPTPRGKVALVLGAGNVASIGPLDTVHKLFNEGQVVILKLNPVNDYLGPFFEDTFSALIRDGYVRVVYGGAEVGSYLVHHPDVDEIHITGSDRTHDAIVFGRGAEGAARKVSGQPLLEKRITSELGNVSPVIVVPGKWSEADLAFQAENVATQMTMNGGFNCNAAKVIVTHRYWPQRQAFLDALRSVLSSLPPRPAYYPGAEERYDTFLEAHPDGEVLGHREPGVLPAALLPDLDPDRADTLAFTNESFCSVAAETALGGVGTEGFLAEAVRFCNERLHGTLNAEILVEPTTERQLGPKVEQAIADLRYGSVAVNHWPALSYGLGTTTWGAYPGHTLQDVQSGIGTVHNTLMFDKPEKSVIWGPFRVFPKPPWFVTHKTGHRVAERMTQLEANPGLGQLPGVVMAALLG